MRRCGATVRVRVTSCGSATRERRHRRRSARARGAFAGRCTARRRLRAAASSRWSWPQPRVALGVALRGVATQRDRLERRLGRATSATCCALARRRAARWPHCHAARCWPHCHCRCSSNACWVVATTTSCCSARPHRRAPAVQRAAAQAEVAVSRIGEIAGGVRPARAMARRHHLAVGDHAASTTSRATRDDGLVVATDRRVCAAARRLALHVRASGASDRAGLRQRPVAEGRRARSARCGPGPRSWLLAAVAQRRGSGRCVLAGVVRRRLVGLHAHARRHLRQS